MQWRPRPALSRPAPRREPDSLAAGVRPPAGRDPRRAAAARAPSSPRSRSPSSSASAAGRSGRRSAGLASEGLVTVRPRRGAVVRSLSKEEFLELYQVREALEMMAVRLRSPAARPRGHRRARGLIDDDGGARRARRGRRVLRGERRLPRRSGRGVGQPRSSSELYRAAARPAGPLPDRGR